MASIGTLSYRRRLILLSLALVLTTASTARATQDVEEPESIIGLLKLVMTRPEITGEIQRLVNGGCSWVQEVFWSDSHSEEDLNTETYWMTFSIQFQTQDEATHWVPFSFRYNKDGIVRVEVPSEELKQIQCQ